jgi:lysophospholipase L1-like esterase
MIGDVYPAVAAVAHHLAEICYLAANLDNLKPLDVELRSNDATQAIEWRYVEEGAEWQVLVSYVDLLGADVQEVLALLQQVSAQVAADAAQVAADRIVCEEAVDLLTGSISLTPAPGKIPIADENGHLHQDWFEAAASHTVGPFTLTEGQTEIILPDGFTTVGMQVVVEGSVEFAWTADAFDQQRFTLNNNDYLAGTRVWCSKGIAGASLGMLFASKEKEYVDGVALTVDTAAQVIIRGDERYLAKLPATLPLTLTGTWATDSANLVLLGDDVLRQELAAADSDVLVGGVEAGKITQRLADAEQRLPDDDAYKFLKYVGKTNQLNPIYIVGDSITEGAGSTDVTTKSYAAIIRSSINKHFGNRNFGFFNFNLISPETIDGKYVRGKTTSGSITSIFLDSGFGGIMVQLNSVGAYYEFKAICKDIAIVYAQDAGGGSAEVTIDGVSRGTFNSASSGATADIAGVTTQGQFTNFFNGQKWDLHTIRITCTTAGNGVRLLGATMTDGNYRVPTVFNVGRSSLRTVQIPDALLQSYASSGCSILALGVNDQANNTDIVEFERKLRVLLDRIVLLNSECIMLDFIFNQPSSNPYKAVIKNLAVEYDRKLFDFSELWFGSQAPNVSNNLLTSDGVHPSDIGHAFIARTVLDYIGVPFNPDTINDDSYNGTLTALSGWQADTIVGYPSPYLSLARDQVIIQGFVQNKSGGDLTSGSPIVTLPFLATPTNVGRVPFTVQSSVGPVAVEVNAPNNQLRLASGASVPNDGWVSLAGVSYSVAGRITG